MRYVTGTLANSKTQTSLYTIWVQKHQKMPRPRLTCSSARLQGYTGCSWPSLLAGVMSLQCMPHFSIVTRLTKELFKGR